MIVKSDKAVSTQAPTAGFRKALPQILAVCVKNVLLLGFGMTLGFPTILIPSLSGSDPEEKISLGEESISWIGSINLICVPIGCLLSGAITQPIGRKRAMQIVNIPFLLAWGLFHFSTDVWQVFLALCITGFTGGLLEAPVLTYVAEITEPHLRGMLSSTSTMSINLGVLCSFLLGTFLNWRIVVLVNSIVPILAFVLLFFVPESPHWLISKKRFTEAKESIAWLRGWTTLENVEQEFQELCDNLGANNNNFERGMKEEKSLSRVEHLKLFTKKNFIWPYFLVGLTFFLGHFGGNTPLQVYAIKIFSVLNAPIDKYYATVLMGVVQLLGCIMCVTFVNLLGKRIINFISLLGSGICFLIVATYAYKIDVFHFERNGNDTAVTSAEYNVTEKFHWVPMTFLVLSAFLTYIGIKVLPWILIGEVYSNETRSTASGLSGGLGYIFGFSSNKIFLDLVSHLTLPGVFWLYACVSFVGFVLLYFLLPETEGKSLFHITEHFAGRKKLGRQVLRKNAKSGISNVGFQGDDAVENVFETKF